MNKRILKKYLIGEFSFKRLVKSIIFVFVTTVIYGCTFSESIIFQPPRASYSDASDLVRIKTANGEKICAYHMINPDAEFTILYSHGNAEDIGHNRFYFNRFVQRGYSVLGYDYRGYGCSEGKPSEKNAYEDIEAAYKYLIEKGGVNPGKIIVMGRSVGGGPSVHLASNEYVAGLVLQSSFTSAFRVVTRASLLPFDKFNNIAKIKKIDCPILVMHGMKDGVIAPWHGKALYEAANEPKICLWVEGIGHNDDMAAAAGDKYWKSIEYLIERIDKG